MSPTVLVIDTSYLLELYKVPTAFTPAAHQEVRARFARAIKNKSPRYVPFPVIFEVANHIAHGPEGRARVELGRRFVADVLQSFERAETFVVTPALDTENLKALLRVFSGEMVQEGIGLTDGSMIHEARRLKAKYGPHARVHIWTQDRHLKAREPDREPDPFVG